MVSVTKILYFNNDNNNNNNNNNDNNKMAKDLCSVIWQYHDQRRRVSHTVRAWKTGRNFDLDGTRAFSKR